MARRGSGRYDFGMLKVTVNGEQHELADGASVKDLVEMLKLQGKPVAVEVNREVVPKRAHANTVLHEGDVVEVVTLVGGG